jgi:hypothetical protein
VKTLAAIALSFALSSSAQITTGKLSFALPEHPGILSLDQGSFQVKELSAKANEREWGIRAEDGALHLLAFLFVVPEQPHMTAESCRGAVMKSDGITSTDLISFKSKTGVDIAAVLIIPADGKSSSIRSFVASADLCGDLLVSYDRPITDEMMPMQKVKTFLETLQFDPHAKPTFRDAFAYATVEWDKHQIKGSVTAYRAALALADTSDDPLKWRRVTTDQLSMAYGMSGDLKQSRAVNEAAIKRDSTYPLYYYNLACVDAEEGNATSAHIHLQQAFERKANTLRGETLPDPATDDSILKLKNDSTFWAFVQTLKH